MSKSNNKTSYNKTKKNQFKKTISKYERKKNESSNSFKTFTYSTGVILLDQLIGGGLPKGKIIGIGGETSVGKTTLLLQICCNVIERYNKDVYYIDVEGGASSELINALNCSHHISCEDNPDGRLHILDINTIQDISVVVKGASEDPETAIIVVDSETQVIDEDMKSDDLGSSYRGKGSHATMWSRMARTFTAVIRESNACLIMVHQARQKLKGFSQPVASSGGNAMKHMTSIEIWLSYLHKIDENLVVTKNTNDSSGVFIELTTSKNRLSLPNKKIELPLLYGKGVSNLSAFKKWLSEYEYNDGKSNGRNFITQRGPMFDLKIPPIGISETVKGYAELNALIEYHQDSIRAFIERETGWDVLIR